MRRKRIHGHRRVARSPIKHEAEYPHEHYKGQLSPGEMDNIYKREKKGGRKDFDLLFETEKQRKRRIGEERGYITKYGTGIA